jgi:hypothetical protein
MGGFQRRSAVDPGPLRAPESRSRSGIPLGKASAPDRIRTCDLRFRRPTLYPGDFACGGCVFVKNRLLLTRLLLTHYRNSPE